MNYFNYFTEIEDHFARRRGKHLLVSPLDWSLIATWRDSGIPLHVAMRGIDIAMDSFFSKPNRRGRVNSLFYCHETVMEEYQRHLESHVGEDARPETSAEKKSASGSEEGPDKDTVKEFLAARISEIKSLPAKLLGQQSGTLVEVLDRILSRLEEIAKDLADTVRVDLESLDRDLGILDDVLTNELRAAVTPEQMRGWEEEAKKELKMYRKRLPKETYQRILENFLRGKIHRWFDLGELSLFHL
jgi:hypothetical protein